MNNKHIAVLVVLLLCILIAQGLLSFHQRVTAVQKAAATAERTAKTTEITLRGQRVVLDELKRNSGDLIAFLDLWEDHLSRISTPEGGEVNVNTLVKQAGLFLLAQRFELTANKAEGSVAGEATIPQIFRAHLTIEDDFVKTINWLGEVESKLPTARVSNLQLTRGQSGNDLRVNLALDIPLARARATPAPAAVPAP